jgi:metallo-beta-lactamase class B
MRKRTMVCVVSGWLLLISVAVLVLSQGRGAAPPAPKPETQQSLLHIDAARKIAGDDTFLSNPFNFFCIPANTRANNPNAPELQPIKLFDNVYAIGNSETTIYAIETSDGIVLIDAGYADRVETSLVGGLLTLGLIPSEVKYILLGHGHADHFGGARYFQDRYGSKIGAAAADWDLINPSNPPANQNPAGNQARPQKDFVIVEGQPIKLGGLSVTPVAIPGHTPGSLAFIFPVKDKGKTRMAGVFAGTMLTLDRVTTDGLKEYIQSIAHYVDIAKKMKVEVELQNHPIFDGMPDKLSKLKGMTVRDPNPFVVGTDRYLKMWNIISECVQAEVARRPD